MQEIGNFRLKKMLYQMVWKNMDFMLAKESVLINNFAVLSRI